MSEDRAGYKVKPSNWEEPEDKCCPTFSAAIDRESAIWWDSAKHAYVLSGPQPIAFCPFCGANVTAVPE